MFRPIGDRVLVRLIEGASKSPGGIIIPENAKEKPTQGVVVSVGGGRITDHGTLIEPRVATGNIVLFGKYAGTSISVGGEELTLLKEEDIFGVMSMESA